MKLRSAKQTNRLQSLTFTLGILKALLICCIHGWLLWHVLWTLCNFLQTHQLHRRPCHEKCHV